MSQQIDDEYPFPILLYSINEPSKLWRIIIADNHTTVPRLRTIIYSLAQGLRKYAIRSIYKPNIGGVEVLTIFDHDVILDIKAFDPAIYIECSIPEMKHIKPFKIPKSSLIVDTSDEMIDIISLFDVSVIDKPIKEHLDEFSKRMNSDERIITQLNIAPIPEHHIQAYAEKRQNNIDTFIKMISW